MIGLLLFLILICMMFGSRGVLTLFLLYCTMLVAGFLWITHS